MSQPTQHPQPGALPFPQDVVPNADLAAQEGGPAAPGLPGVVRPAPETVRQGRGSGFRRLLLGTLCLAAPLLLTPLLASDAPPPVTEQALQRVLAGDTAGAIRLLEEASSGKTPDPSLRWLAGKLALEAGDLKSAERLLSDSSGAAAWARVELLLKQGKREQAAQEALSRMEAALSGTHRDTLALKLLEWGTARERDRSAAEPLLATAWKLASSEATRLKIEESYFPLLDADPDLEQLSLLIERLEKHPEHLAARLAVARSLATHQRYGQIKAMLEPVLRGGAKSLALEAGRLISNGNLPPSEQSQLLDGLLVRFPGDAEVGNLLLEHATRLAQNDSEAGGRRLEALSLDPILRKRALTLWAEQAPTPAERRSRWLKLANLEAASDLGSRARTQASEALIEGVTSQPEGPARQKAAADALLQSDVGNNPLLRYYAMGPAPAAASEGSGASPSDAAGRLKRLESLWELVEKYPTGGPWCSELARTLVEMEADAEPVRKLQAGCSSQNTPEAQALAALQGEQPFLLLSPKPGKAELLSAGVDAIEISEHDLDPVTLFRSQSGSPLNASLDAFLTTPDRTWTLDLPAEKAVRRALVPRAAVPLVAMTVRGGELRSTLLVQAGELEVQTVTVGDEVAYAVLRDGQPVPGASLLWRTAGGVEVTSKTDASGLGQQKLPPGNVRVLAQAGNALGYAAVSVQAARTEPGALVILTPDKALPVGGGRVKVGVLATRLSQPIPDELTLTSLGALGEVLEEVPLKLQGGWATATVLAQGRGRFTVRHKQQVLAATNEQPVAPEFADRDQWASPFVPSLPDDLALTVMPPRPRAGETVTVVAWRLGRQPLEAPALTLDAWLSGKRWTAAAPSGDAPAQLTLTLPSDQGADTLRLRVGAQEGESSAPAAGSSTPEVWTREVAVAAALEKTPDLPSLVSVGQPVEGGILPDAWWKISQGAQILWISPKSPLVLPKAGDWSVSVWKEGTTYSSATLTALDPAGPVSPDGRLQVEKPTLWVQADARIRRIRLGAKGGLLELSSLSDSELSWWTPGNCELSAIPLRAPKPPSLTVTGTVTRGSPSILELGRGLPPGTRLWAYLHDASDDRLAPRLEGLELPTWQPGGQGTVEVRTSTVAVAIAGDLLQEERLEEEAKDELLDLDRAAAAEVNAAPMPVLMGSGMGGGGYGRGSGFGRASRRQSMPTVQGRTWGAWPQALAVLENGAPGSWTVQVPDSTTTVSVRLLARLPSGVLVQQERMLSVQGPSPVLASLTPASVDRRPWEGTLASLLERARALPLDVKVLVLAGLEKQGHPELKVERLAAEQALRSGLRQGKLAPQALPGLRLATFLNSTAAPDGQAGLESLVRLPDARVHERAEAVLLGSAADPARASGAARRLLEVSALPLTARLRAGLTLWTSGSAEEALKALEGADPLLQAARALIQLEGGGTAGGKSAVSKEGLDAAAASSLLQVASSPLALPVERALAFQALGLQTLGRSTGSVVNPAGEASTGTASQSTASQSPDPKGGALTLSLWAPLATARGQLLSRGFWGGSQDGPVSLATPEAPARRWIPVTTTVGPLAEPSRLVCPKGDGLESLPQVIELEPLYSPNTVECKVWAEQKGKVALKVQWVDARGRLLAGGETSLTIQPAKVSSLSDPMSPSERLGLALLLSREGAPEAASTLKGLLGRTWIPDYEVRRASEGLFFAALKRGTPAEVVSAFEGYRERSTDGELSLTTAAALARAFAAIQKPEKAVAATQLVMDARLQEELEAVNVLQAGEFRLAAVQFIRLLLSEYPEVPTAEAARYLGASSLLELADAPEPPRGASRTALRKTGVEQLARFLLLNRKGEKGAEAAALLLDTLQLLREPAREEALAGALAGAYKESPLAWKMVVSHARAQVARGRYAEAAKLLQAVEQEGEGQDEVALTLGRALEGLGKTDAALEAYQRFSGEEAGARAAFLTRTTVTVPDVQTFGLSEPLRLKGWLPAGTTVKVVAYRIALEDLLLRDGGAVNPEAVRVDGLRPAASLERTVGRDGDVSLPGLKEGAYLLTVGFGSELKRLLVIRGELELWVQPGELSEGGRSLALETVSGAGVGDASVWVWQRGGQVSRLRTDLLGRAFVPTAEVTAVLARKGDGYAVWQARSEGEGVDDDQSIQRPMGQSTESAPVQSQMRSRLLQESNEQWDQLFENKSRSQVKAAKF